MDWNTLKGHLTDLAKALVAAMAAAALQTLLVYFSHVDLNALLQHTINVAAAFVALKAKNA